MTCCLLVYAAQRQHSPSEKSLKRVKWLLNVLFVREVIYSAEKEIMMATFYKEPI